ncbi:MAG: hypothetical protein WB801_10625 [Candidatus Dormiibacterota bacterium]
MVAVRLSLDLGEVASRVCDELLGHSDLVGLTAAALHEGQRQKGLSFGAYPLSVAIRPQLLSPDRYSQVVKAAGEIASALQTLEVALLADPGLRAELDLVPEEEELALADPGFRHSSPVARLDSFCTDQVRYVEYNAETPAGIAYGEELAAVFDQTPLLRGLRQRFRLRALVAQDRQLEALLGAYREWGGRGTPRIAIVDWPGLPTVREFELCREYFGRHGVPATICEPAELQYRDGVLRDPDGEAVGLVYRRVLCSELLNAGDQGLALRQAYLDRAVCVVNSFRAKLLHKKMSFALLSDPRHHHLFSPTQLKAIERHVPWTRKLADGPSSARDKPIPDLVEHTLKHRERLALKPNDEYGGRGVVLGWETSASDWERALALGVAQSSVVQEAVPVPWQEWEVVLDGRVTTTKLAVDMDPYLFGGQVGGVMTRVSSSALLNLTAGAGSVVPTYVVEAAL